MDNLLDRSIRFDFGSPRGCRVFRRCLVILIVCSLLFPPSVFGSSQIAVLELFHPDLDTDLTGRLADRVRSDLREKGEPVVSREETAARLQSGSEPLAAVLEKAKGHYYSLRFGAARTLLDETLARLERGELTADDTLHLAPAYVLLGTVYYDNESRALSAFEEAARLDPALQLSEREHSPRIRGLFRKARERLSSRETRTGALKVDSSPAGGEIFVDGKSRGKGPLRLEKLIPGRHYVAVRRAGFRDGIKVVSVPENGEEEVRLDLEKSPEASPSLAVSELRDDSALYSDTIAAGRKLGVTELVLIGVENSGGKSRATLRRVNLARTWGVSRKEVSLGGNDKGIGRAARELVAFLTPEETKPARIGKPFWKKPLFWIIGGAVLAGAGAGVGIALSGGGSGGTSEVGVTVTGGVPSIRVQLR